MSWSKSRVRLRSRHGQIDEDRIDLIADSSHRIASTGRVEIMGMVGCFAAVSANELERFQMDPDSLTSYLFPDEGDPPAVIDVDKAWHAIHFLLTGSAEDDGTVASLAVLGGTEIGEDLEYGPVRFLTSAEVQAVAEEIEQLNPEELTQRYRPDVMDEIAIYPQIWTRDGDEGLDYIREWYQEMRKFYLDARDREAAVLHWLA